MYLCRWFCWKALISAIPWYMPGGKSTTAGFYADAGGEYILKNENHSGSVPLAFETVFDKGQNADFWLIKYNQPTNMLRSLLYASSSHLALLSLIVTSGSACNEVYNLLYSSSPISERV